MQSSSRAINNALEKADTIVDALNKSKMGHMQQAVPLRPVLHSHIGIDRQCQNLPIQQSMPCFLKLVKV